jgi:hypothetical protein
MDFFGVVGAARHHVILFIVLTASWGFAETWLANFSFTGRLFYPVLRLFVVTAGSGLLSFPAGLLSDVNAVFNTIASIAIIGVWSAASVQTAALVAPHIVPTLEHPLLIKHTAPLLKAEWFVRIRTTYNDAYYQAFREASGQGPGEGTGQQQEQQQSRQSNDDDGRITYKRALEIMELSEGATDKEIQEAFSRLMQKVHPDLGGSNFFAKQLNAARDVLLKRESPRAILI